MSGASGERTYTVRWQLRAGHREAGTISGHTWWVSTAGLAFVSPVPYREAELVEMEIHIDLSTFVRCVVRITGSERASAGVTAYKAVFVSLSEQNRAIIAGTLLAIRRQQLAADYGPLAWSRQPNANKPA